MITAKRLRTLIILIIAAISATAFAQEGYEHFSVFSHGSGRSYVVNSIGLNAVGLNPALLDYDHSKRFEVRIFPIAAYGLDAGSSFRNASVLGNVFDIKPDSNGRFSDEKIKDVTNTLNDNKLSGRGDVNILGVAYHTPDYGSFAFTWTTHAALRTEIPQAFLNFFYNAASNLLQESGSYTDFDLQGLWYSEYALSYARNLYTATDSLAYIKSLHGGVSLKYVGGIGILKLLSGNHFSYQAVGGGTYTDIGFTVLSSLTDDFDPQHVPNRFSFDFLASSHAGSGLGVDIGFASSMGNTKSGKPPIYVGASITDIGYINWTDHTKIRHGENQRDSIFADGTIKDLSDTLNQLQGKLVDTSGFTTKLPTMLRIGAKIDLDAMGTKIGSFAPAISAEFDMGLTDMVGSLKNPRFGLGFAMGRNSDASLPLRFGAGFVIEKDASDITLAAGTTIFDFVKIDIATAHFLDLFSSGSRLDLAFSISATF